MGNRSRKEPKGQIGTFAGPALAHALASRARDSIYRKQVATPWRASPSVGRRVSKSCGSERARRNPVSRATEFFLDRSRVCTGSLSPCRFIHNGLLCAKVFLLRTYDTFNRARGVAGAWTVAWARKPRRSLVRPLGPRLAAPAPQNFAGGKGGRSLSGRL